MEKLEGYDSRALWQQHVPATKSVPDGLSASTLRDLLLVLHFRPSHSARLKLLRRTK